MKRVFLIVLDSCGVGALPDAGRFGDVGADTLRRISSSEKFAADKLIEMGLGNISGIDYLPAVKNPTAAYCKLAERSMGKDTTLGHWEIAGVVSPAPLPTYPNGFPKEVINEFTRLTGRGILCNLPYSGTEVIKAFGEEHLKTGKLIVYTSADSVFQIAAHESLIPPEQLYEYCRIARKILVGRHAVGRVIARPFTGEYPFTRTANRRDFSLVPPTRTLLDSISESGQAVYAIGKIFDIFSGKGITEHVFTHSNSEGINRAVEALDRDFEGLCFVNLVDFDMLYGHRQDVDGYAAALAEFNRRLPEITSRLRDDDMLMITADHGCDPGDDSTDHTREYIPLLIYGRCVKPIDLGIRDCFSDISATIAEYLGVEPTAFGNSFLSDICDSADK